LIRGLFHALGILALAALGVLIQLTIEQPWPISGQLGDWAWVWGGLGVTCALGCALAAVAAGAGWQPRPLVLLALPSALLVAAGAVLFVGVGDVLATYDEVVADELYEVRWKQLVWRGTFVWMEAALAAMWAAIGFTSSVAVAGARAPLPGQRRGFDVVALVPGPLAAAFAAAVFVLFYGAFDMVLVRNGVGAAFAHVGETFAGLGFVEAAWLLLPIAPWLLILLVLPAGYRPLQIVGRVDTGEGDGGKRCALALAGLSGVAAAATFGVVASGRASTLHHIIAVSSAKTLAETQAFLSMPFVSGGRVGHAAVPTTAAILAALGGLALLLLLTGRPRVRPLVLPGLLVGLAFLGASGQRLGATARVGAAFGPVCEEDCTHLDRATALLRGADYIPNERMRQDPCGRFAGYGPKARDLALPRVPGGECIQAPSATLRVGREALDLDGQLFPLSLLEEAVRGDRESGGLAHRLQEKFDDARAVAVRNPSQPVTYLMLGIDASYPWATVAGLRRAAGEGGWCVTAFFVDDPAFDEPTSTRLIPVGLSAGKATRPELTHGLAVTAGGLELLTATGDRHPVNASTPGLDPAILRLRPAAARSTLVLCPDDDRSIEEVLRLRQSLVPLFDQVLFESTCEEAWVAGTPDPFCARFDEAPRSGSSPDPEGGGAGAEAVEADVP